jgi:hypothetical protein
MLRRLSLLAPMSVAVAVVTACHTFGPVASPQDYVTAKKPPRVWVTEPDGSVSVFEGPKLLGDTLAGFVKGEYREVPLADVKSVSARQSAPKRTRAVIVVGSVATIGFMLFVATGGLGVSTIPPDDEEPPN